jgi:spore coat protein A
LVAVIFCPTDAVAETVVIVPSRDNTLYELVDGSRSNGVGENVFVGKVGSGEIRRAVLAFDIASQIAAGSTVTDVTLTLYMSRTQSADSVVDVRRLTSDWGEGASAPFGGGGGGGGGGPAATGDATWLHTFYSESLWASVGGDYDTVLSANTVVDQEGYYAWTAPGLVTDVQSWLDSPVTNNGWILLGDESTSQTAKRFDSREHPDPQRRPVLTVTFTSLPNTGACCDGVTCGVLTAGNCASQGGTYLGDGVDCTPLPCAVPTGACCASDGMCTTAEELDCLAASGSYQGDGTTCSLELCPVELTPYLDPLPLPAVAVPVSGIPGDVATYDLDITEFEQQLHGELPPTTVWGYGGTFPGPTIEASTELPVTINWINDLRDRFGALRSEHYLPVDLCPHGPNTEGNNPRTVVHLHGGHVPAEVDGYPTDTILPGEQHTYVYPNNQLPATLWYHDHAMGITRLNVYMGLAGFYLIRDAFEQALALPTGEFEVPIVMQDRSFNSDGSLRYPADWQDHFFGDKMVVNGRVWPYMDVKQATYRLRLMNGCNSRTLRLTLSNGAAFNQIGVDGGLLPAPLSLTSITLASAERADVVLDFSTYPAGTEIFMVNDAPAPYPGSPGVGVIPEVMKFIVNADVGPVVAAPASLRPLGLLNEAQAVVSRDFEMHVTSDPCSGSKWLINGLGWHDITEYPMLGTTEIWRFINRSGMMHPMHMHLVNFQVLDRQAFTLVDDEVVPVGSPFPPEPNEVGWKDTVRVDPFEMVRVIAKFEDYVGKFPYHCHILEHEDHEMMRQFETVAPPIPTASEWSLIVLTLGLLMLGGAVIRRRQTVGR